MLVIRPIQRDDLDQILDLLKEAGHGLTSLPKDPELLGRKINLSVNSFNDQYKWGPNGELYLFVMEDIFLGQVVGVSGLISKIGGFQPFYFYQLKQEYFHSDSLNKDNELMSLHIHKIHSGPAEICSLYLAPQFRNAQNGRLLSLSRFLYIAEHRQHFEDEIIAEMRGQVDDTGHSPFWEAVGKKFFQIPFPEADYMMEKCKKFIEELLPDYPILIPLLPVEAQQVVAQVHPQTEPAKHILQHEGFEQSDLVGIFEPGPVLKAQVDQIRSLQKSKRAKIEFISEEKEDQEKIHIISTVCGKDFRACIGAIWEKENQIGVSAVIASALKLKIGDQIRYVSLK